MSVHHAPTPGPRHLPPATGELVRLIGTVEDAQLDQPTPCADWSVRDLLTHVRGFTAASAAAALRSEFPADAAELHQPLPATWRNLLPEQAERLAAAWADPRAWQGHTEAAGIQTPANVAGSAALQEVVLHGWDLARAAGQPFRPDPECVDACLTFVGSLSQPDRAQVFSAPVDVPAGASPLDRLLGASGRDPAWRPGAAR